MSALMSAARGGLRLGGGAAANQDEFRHLGEEGKGLLRTVSKLQPFPKMTLFFVFPTIRHSTCQLPGTPILLYVPGSPSDLNTGEIE